MLQTSQDFEAEAEAQEMQNPPKPDNTGKPPPQQSSGQGDDGEGEQGEPSEGGNQVTHLDLCRAAYTSFCLQYA